MASIPLKQPHMGEIIKKLAKNNKYCFCQFFY